MTKSTISRFLAVIAAALLAVTIAACGKPGSSSEPDGGTTEQTEDVQTEGGSGEDSLAVGPQILVYEGASSEEKSAVKSLTQSELACSVVTSVSEADIAEALSSGSAVIAVVPLDMAARFFNSYECPCMAIDATEGSAVPIASVVSNAYFGSDPETVVKYVSLHESAAQSSGLTFYSGTAMNDYLSDAMNSLFVLDSSMVGGQLLPDNFYFLG